MKFFSKKWYETMQDAHLLTFPESDEEWADFIRGFEEESEDFRAYLRGELESIKDRLLQILPETFHPYVLDGTINQPELPKRVRDEVLAWLKEKQEEAEKVIDAAGEYKEKIRGELPEGLAEIADAGLHDAQIRFIRRGEDVLRLTLDGSGSFSCGEAAVIEISGIKEERSEFPLAPGMYWLYEETDVERDGFRLGVLFDSPMTEWEITATDFRIRHFYRNEEHPGWADEDGPAGASAGEWKKAEQRLGFRFPQAFRELMNRQNGGRIDHPFFLLPDRAVEITRILPLEELAEQGGVIPFAACTIGSVAFLRETGRIVYVAEDGEPRPLADSFEEWTRLLLSGEFVEAEDPLSDPLPPEELEAALFSGDLGLAVRAWNTIAERPEEHVPLIKKALPHFINHEDIELGQIGELFAGHFVAEGIITEEFLESIKR